jgi:hypothetical protein
MSEDGKTPLQWCLGHLHWIRYDHVLALFCIQLCDSVDWIGVELNDFSCWICYNPYFLGLH